MQRENIVVPECYVDTNLISTLIGADANHQKGCNSVARILQTQKKDDFAIGIIDKDKKRPGYVDEFELLAQRDHLELYKHPTKPHYFILVVKAVETLLLENAKVLGLEVVYLDSYSEVYSKIRSRTLTSSSKLFLFDCVLIKVVTRSAVS